MNKCQQLSCGILLDHRWVFSSLLILCVIVTSYLYSEWWRSPVHHKGHNETIVLVWYWPFHMSVPPNPTVCSHFGIHNCLLVDDRSWYPYADFVVLHNRELIYGQERLPSYFRRPPEQRWVWVSLESPENNGNLWPLSGYFNAIMSYSRNADFYLPYGRLLPREEATALTEDDFIPKNKSALACWVVSNYQDTHRRSTVYKQLRTVIPVELYGNSVGRPLSSDDLLPTISRCYFYLSFENSMYKDYITEKFWKNALQGGAVPVVLGAKREEYEAVVPRDSFIHVDDFPSVEELGHFLVELANDRHRYASYFAWHLNYTVDIFDDWQEEFCKICPQASSVPQKVYQNLDSWEVR